jgi:hypothetical protein
MAYLPVLALLAIVVAAELVEGHSLICKCGYVKLWEGNVHSSGNSQHFSDWYSLSHIIHGFIFFGLTFWLMRAFSVPTRLFAATLVEGAWEILENSPIIIDRYRAATISLDYFGDSILNSVSDILFMMFGFWLASRLPWKATLAIAIFFELLALYVIRDNLTLNIIMLVWPIDAIRDWQAAL